MGKKAAFLLVHFGMVALTYVTALLTIVAGWAGVTPAQRSWFVTWLSLGMMPLLLINFCFLLWWIGQWRRFSLLPLTILLLNIPFITAMFQLDLRPDEYKPPELKILSYNMCGFGQADLKGTMENIVRYLTDEKVDIVCFQEFWATPTYPLDSICATFAPRFAHHAAYHQPTGLELAIFSRFPISNSELLSFSGTANSTLWADVELPGLPIRVFNAHFQTTNFNQSSNELARIKNKGITDISGKKAFDVIVKRLKNNAFRRTEQVTRVRNVMDTTKRAIIVCTDLNDTPASYAYKRVKGDLVDGFKSAGEGYAYTYKSLFRIFRLDYIFYDARFDGLRYYSPRLSWSDHNPVVLELAFGSGEKER